MNRARIFLMGTAGIGLSALHRFSTEPVTVIDVNTYRPAEPTPVLLRNYLNDVPFNFTPSLPKIPVRIPCKIARKINRAKNRRARKARKINHKCRS